MSLTLLTPTMSPPTGQPPRPSRKDQSQGPGRVGVSQKGLLGRATLKRATPTVYQVGRITMPTQGRCPRERGLFFGGGGTGYHCKNSILAFPPKPKGPMRTKVRGPPGALWAGPAPPGP